MTTRHVVTLAAQAKTKTRARTAPPPAVLHPAPRVPAVDVITTRDIFAAHALNGLCVRPNGGLPDFDPGHLAALAYRMADAMMSERESHG